MKLPTKLGILSNIMAIIGCEFFEFATEGFHLLGKLEQKLLVPQRTCLINQEPYRFELLASEFATFFFELGLIIDTYH